MKFFIYISRVCTPMFTDFLCILVQSSAVIKRSNYHDIIHGTGRTAAELKSDFKLTGELWGVYCEDFGEDWPWYNGPTLYPDGRHSTLTSKFFLQHPGVPGKIQAVVPNCHAPGRLIGMLQCVSHRADSRLAPSQWETSLQSNAVSHWLGINLESALMIQMLCYSFHIWNTSKVTHNKYTYNIHTK